MNHRNPEDALVIKVLSNPYQLYGKWFVDIIWSSYGRESDGELMFSTKDEASAISPGYRFRR